MSYKCAICKVESETEEAFLSARSSYTSEKILYCPACWEKRAIQQGKSYLTSCLAVLVLGIVWVLAYPQNEFAWLTFQIGLFWCFATLLVVPHELGHVLAAFLTKAKVFQVTIGLGPTMYNRIFWGIEWKLCSIPLGGFVITGVGNRTLYRTRSFLASLGGPLANCILAFIALILLYRVSSPWLLALLKPFLVANIYILLYSLLPTRTNVTGRSALSDGLALLTRPFMSKLKIEQEIEAYHAWEDYYNSMKNSRNQTS